MQHKRRLTVKIYFRKLTFSFHFHFNIFKILFCNHDFRTKDLVNRHQRRKEGDLERQIVFVICKKYSNTSRRKDDPGSSKSNRTLQAAPSKLKYLFVRSNFLHQLLPSFLLNTNRIKWVSQAITKICLN